jgi:hypothetical protein
MILGTTETPDLSPSNQMHRSRLSTVRGLLLPNQGQGYLLFFSQLPGIQDGPTHHLRSFTSITHLSQDRPTPAAICILLLRVICQLPKSVFFLNIGRKPAQIGIFLDSI